MIELTLKADRRLSAEHGLDTHFVLLSFRAPHVEKTGARPALNLSLVLDRSGSMAGENKLSLARQAANQALARLTAGDRFSLVIYDDDIDVLVPSRMATPLALHDARLALSRVEARGTTALFDGYLRGAEQVAEHLRESETGKVLLLTDGLANVGITDAAAITRHVAALRARGVYTSTFGVGADFNQLLLDGMADAGGGSFYFVEKAKQLEDLLTSEVGEALAIAARDVRVVAEHARDVEVRLLDAFVVEADGRGLTSRLGALTSEQVVELLYEVNVPGHAVGTETSLRFSVADQDGALGAPAGSIVFRHVTDAEADAEEADADVVRRAAHRIRLEASEHIYSLNYVGRLAEVGAESSKALEYLRRLAKKIPEVATLVGELEQDVLMAGAPLDATVLKMQYYAASRLRRGRGPEGKAIKKPS